MMELSFRLFSRDRPAEEAATVKNSDLIDVAWVEANGHLFADIWSKSSSSLGMSQSSRANAIRAPITRWQCLL
jgi:hypothetical protein